MITGIDGLPRDFLMGPFFRSLDRWTQLLTTIPVGLCKMNSQKELLGMGVIFRGNNQFCIYDADLFCVRTTWERVQSMGMSRRGLSL
jgi:hypothetical protein